MISSFNSFLPLYQLVYVSTTVDVLAGTISEGTYYMSIPEQKGGQILMSGPSKTPSGLLVGRGANYIGESGKDGGMACKTLVPFSAHSVWNS